MRVRGIIGASLVGLALMVSAPVLAQPEEAQVIELSDIRPIYRQGMVGVGLYFNFIDETRSIVDLGITVKPYDSYGLLVIGKFRENVPALLKLNGTVSVMAEPVWLEWEKIWKDPNVTCVELQSVKVVYDDGSQEFYFRNLKEIAGEGLPSCRK